MRGFNLNLPGNHGQGNLHTTYSNRSSPRNYEPHPVKGPSSELRTGIATNIKGESEKTQKAHLLSINYYGNIGRY